MSRSQKWVDDQGAVCEVQTKGATTKVVRGASYCRPGSVSCQLKDTGNGYIVRFPAHSSVEQDQYICLDYSQARELVLALTPHSEALGFKAS